MIPQTGPEIEGQHTHSTNSRSSSLAWLRLFVCGLVCPRSDKFLMEKPQTGTKDSSKAYFSKAADVAVKLL
jgi:hypothetical protein